MRTLLIIFLMTLTACNPLKLQAPACQNKNEPGETCTKMVSLKTMQENLLKNKENISPVRGKIIFILYPQAHNVFMMSLGT